MSKTISTVCFLVITFSANLFSQDKILIAVGEYPPLVSKHLKYYGVTAHIIIEAFALEGVKVEYQFSHWARAFHLVKEGKADGIAPVLKMIKETKCIILATPFYMKPKCFFIKKTMPLIGVRWMI
ncbi:hypothetical protein [Psychromonas sp. Urea-02u-13]|uniref:hypothetical protein n=1 Tax=Psychromonas sp. Urea-02u-13 TaxID=2058326 RepID=UPI0018E32699|nr:hypothetical protein [Psychromonas sp. Urea-02u-13]